MYLGRFNYFFSGGS